MPINTPHPLYTAALPKWKRCRDITEDTDTVKNEGEAYLPALSGQTPGEYSAYKLRAFFYGAARRTVQAYQGLVFRKPPAIEGVAEDEELLNDVTLTGMPVAQLAEAVFFETVRVGRCGIYTALPENGNANSRAYLTLYKAEQIINWQGEFTPDGYKLTRVVLWETIWKPGEDVYTLEEVEQYRELYLDDSGRVAVDLWRETDGVTDGTTDKFARIQETVFPTFRGARLEQIPFEIVNADGETDGEISMPPLLPLVDANLHHYRLMADYNHGLHFCGLPTPWVAGFPAETELKIGSSVAWVTEETDAKVGMLEFTGQGLNPLKEAIEQTVGYMASLGARLLEQDKSAAEAAETHRIRQGREESTISNIANSVSFSLSRAVGWLIELSGATAEAGGIAYRLNSDLVDAKVGAQDLRELVNAWQTGAIGFDTLYHNLRQGELTRPDITAEEERNLIDAETAISTTADNGGVFDGDGDGNIGE